MIFLFKILLLKARFYMKKISKKNNKIKREDIAGEWFKIGDDEFAFGEVNLEENDKFYAHINFLFHQSVEKYLKGYLVAHKIKPAKTHDNASLCVACAKINKEFYDLIDKCSSLNKYYITSRYPVHYEIYNRQDAKEACKTAKEIILFVKKNLK